MKLLISDNKRMAFYLAWFSISLFYFYQYILRVSPGVMVVELRQAYKLTALEFSSLDAIYLYAYSLIQIPLGFVLDRFGIRRVVCISILLCISGVLVFAFSINVGMLQISRFLIGIGSAPAFICALKLVADYLPASKQGILMGATLSIGTIGALLSGKFLVSLLEATTWKVTLMWCAGLGAVIYIIVSLFVPASGKKPGSGQENNFKELMTGLKEIIQRKEILIYSIIAISVYTPLCILADLWGTTFLMEKFALDRADAAQVTLYMYGGLTIGSLILPWLSVRWGVLKGVIQCCAAGVVISLFILLYANSLSHGQLIALLTVTGIFCGAEMICFTGAAQFAPSGRSGLTLGVVNTLNMLGGALIHPLIGGYLDVHWKGHYGIEGARAYGAEELTAAFTILIIIMAGCSLIAAFLPRHAPLNSEQG